MRFADKRKVLNPVALYFGGDVIISSDPHLAPGTREQADPREDRARELSRRLRADRSAAKDLAELGVRWVVVLHEADWQNYRGVDDDPGAAARPERAQSRPWVVEAWKAPVVTESGRGLFPDSYVEPVATLERSGPARWARPAAYGWMPGLSAAGSTENGLVQLPAGGELLWYWPTTVVLLADMLTLTGVVVCIARGRRGRVQRA